MKRCRRCHREISGKEKHCPSCGLKLGFNTTYLDNNHQGKGKLPNYGNKPNKHNNNVNVGCIIFIFIFFWIIFLVITTFVAIVEHMDSSIYEEPFYYELSKEDIEDYLYNTKLLTEDYYKAWTYAKERNELTLKDIENFTSLKEEDMTNVYCQLLEQTYSIDNVLNCVNNAHDDIETYNRAYSDLHALYKIIIENNFSQMEKDILVDIYTYTLNLYYIVYDYKDYESFEYKYNEYINKIESLLDELDNITT